MSIPTADLRALPCGCACHRTGPNRTRPDYSAGCSDCESTPACQNHPARIERDLREYCDDEHYGDGEPHNCLESRAALALHARISELERENKYIKVFEAGITAERDSANARIEAALKLCDAHDKRGLAFEDNAALVAQQVRAALGASPAPPKEGE